MGGLCSGGALTPEEKEAQRMNKLIEKGLVKDRQKLREETKLLLLGTNKLKAPKNFLPTLITNLPKGVENQEKVQYSNK